MKQIILFDGTCHFCDASVQFIIKRDPKGQFHFASLQSEYAQQLQSSLSLPTDLDSMILIKENQAFKKSDAALEIARQLSGPWKLFFGLKILPPSIRDFFYDVIAKNRYRLFGKKTACELPAPEIRERFL